MSLSRVRLPCSTADTCCPRITCPNTCNLLSSLPQGPRLAWPAHLARRPPVPRPSSVAALLSAVRRLISQEWVARKQMTTRARCRRIRVVGCKTQRLAPSLEKLCSPWTGWVPAVPPRLVWLPSSGPRRRLCGTSERGTAWAQARSRSPSQRSAAGLATPSSACAPSVRAAALYRPIAPKSRRRPRCPPTFGITLPSSAIP
mmetsp:Transcript_43155/g.69433  ORF Transcript_43155/g.69433 Transcript_43155/m.69433 type:complete len:201 (-) Transcript_43155:9009-9611(-)